MIQLDRDGALLRPDEPATQPAGQRWGYAELTSQPHDELSGVLGRLLRLAFDELGLQGLRLRITPQADAEAEQAAPVPYDSRHAA